MVGQRGVFDADERLVAVLVDFGCSGPSSMPRSAGVTAPRTGGHPTMRCRYPNRWCCRRSTRCPTTRPRTKRIGCAIGSANAVIAVWTDSYHSAANLALLAQRDLKSAF